MKTEIHLQWLKLLRITIVVQTLVAAWFIFSPDLIPDVIRVAEMKNDRPLYAILDSIIVPLIYIQSLLCLTLWWPSKIASWGYLITGAFMMAISSFAGPAILSAIDGLLGSLQGLAAGAMIAILYMSNFFSVSQKSESLKGV